MSIRNTILKEIIKPAENTHYDMVQAEVLSYDEITNKATIEFVDPRGGGYVTLKDVPVQIGSGGVHSSGPFPGDAVWVNFQNRNPLFPKIISLADKDYENNTRERYSHEKQGAYVTDTVQETITKIVPISVAWAGKKNKEYGYYKDVNPIEQLEEEVKDTKYYSSKEVGLTHPENGSTIKIADDGSISIFTGIGEGIKINPINHSVTILSGNTKTNEGEVTNNMVSWTINCEDEIMINSKGSTTINSQEYLIFRAKDFYFRKEDGTEWSTSSLTKQENSL